MPTREPPTPDRETPPPRNDPVRPVSWQWGALVCPGPRERASTGRCAAARRNRMRNQLAVFVVVLASMGVLIGKWGAFD